MEKEGLDVVKSTIFAILKERGSVTLHSLVSEYERRTGATFPFEKFGCRSPLGFIRTLTDLVIFADENVSLVRSADAVDLPVKCDLSVDIPNGPDSTVDDVGQASEHEVQNREAVQSDLLRKIESILHNHPGGIKSTDFLEAFEEKFGTELDVSCFGYRNISEMVLSGYQSTLFLSEDEGIITLRSHHLQEQPASESNKKEVTRCPRDYLPYEIDNRFERLAKKHPDGMLFSEFCSLYKSLYGPLCPTDFGFPSMLDMVSCGSYVEVKHDGDCCFIFPKIFKEIEDIPTSTSTEDLKPPLEQLSCLWSDVFDEFECDPLFKYSPPEVPEDWAAVEIIDAFSPTDFWIRTKKNEDRVNKLMDELNEYYADAGNLEYHKLPADLTFILPGLSVSGYHMDEWHRATVKSVSSSGIELFFVDFGTTVSDMSPANVKKLPKLFAQLEIIALRAKLWNVRPNGEDNWPMEAFTFIYHEWAYITLRMKIVKVDHSDQEAPEIEAILFSDKSSKCTNNFTRWYPDKVFNLCELLVEEKLGVWIDAPDADELTRDNEMARTIVNQGLEKVQDTGSINREIDKHVGTCPSQHTDVPLETFEANPSMHFNNHFPPYGENFLKQTKVSSRICNETLSVPRGEDKPVQVKLREETILDMIMPNLQKIDARTDAPIPSPTESGYSSKPTSQIPSPSWSQRVQQASADPGCDQTNSEAEFERGTTANLNSDLGYFVNQHSSPPKGLMTCMSPRSNSGQSLLGYSGPELEEFQKQVSSKVMQSVLERRRINSLIVDLHVGETLNKLLVIMEKDLCWVLKEKLFSAAGIPPELAQQRFEQAELNILEVHVNNRNHRKLWEYIHEYDGDRERHDQSKEYVLVPLEDAERICSAINPDCHYKVVYD